MTAPSTLDVVVGWRLDPAAALTIVVFAVAYRRGVQRLAARGRRWDPARSIAAVVAAIAGLVATQSGIGRYDDRSLPVHMVQHLLLGMVVPFALVLAGPLTMLLQTGGPATKAGLRRLLRSRTVRLLTHPVGAWLLFGGGMVAIYLTPLLGLAARNDVVHLLVHAHLVVSGSLFLVGLVGVDVLPHPMPYGARLLAVLTAVPFHAVLGMAMLSSRRPFAPDEYPSLSGQRDAAAILWVVGELFTLAVAGVVVARWYRADQRAAARFDRRADQLAAGSSGS